MANNDEDKQELVASTTPTTMPKENSEFSQEANEAAECAVGEGPQNQELNESYEARFAGAEGNMLMNETLPNDEPIDQDEDEVPAPEVPLPCDTQTKVNQSLFVERLRQLIQNPNTWRIIKGLVVIAVAVKLFNSYETFEQYVPNVLGPK